MLFSKAVGLDQLPIGLTHTFNMIEYKSLYLPDTEEVKVLLDSVWEETYVDCLTPQAMKKISDNWRSLTELSMEEEQNIFVISCFENDVLAGIAIIRKVDAETAEIKRLYVLPDHQGKGIGRRLLTDILIAFAEVERVKLFVEEQNKPAISFYKKFNFEEKEKIKRDINGLAQTLIPMKISLEV